MPSWVVGKHDIARSVDGELAAGDGRVVAHHAVERLAIHEDLLGRHATQVRCRASLRVIRGVQRWHGALAESAITPGRPVLPDVRATDLRPRLANERKRLGNVDRLSVD